MNEKVLAVGETCVAGKNSNEKNCWLQEAELEA